MFEYMNTVFYKTYYVLKVVCEIVTIMLRELITS